MVAFIPQSKGLSKVSLAYSEKALGSPQGQRPGLRAEITPE